MGCAGDSLLHHSETLRRCFRPSSPCLSLCCHKFIVNKSRHPFSVIFTLKRARALLANLPRAARRMAEVETDEFVRRCGAGLTTTRRTPTHLVMPLRCFVLAASAHIVWATPSPTCTPAPTPATVEADVYRRRLWSLGRRLWSSVGPPLYDPDGAGCVDLYPSIAGYTPQSDVWKHANLDLDMADINAALAQDPIGWAEAYETCACALSRRRAGVLPPADRSPLTRAGAPREQTKTA